MTDLTWKERLKYAMPVPILIGVIVMAAFEFKWMQNTLGAKQLAVIFAIIGLLIGGIVGHRFAKKTSDLVEKMRFYALFTIIIGLLMPFVGSWTNRNLAFNGFENRQVEFYEQRGFIAGLGVVKGQNLNPEGYFTYLVIDGQLERFKSVKMLYRNVQKGEMVDLKMKKGLYGFWVVKTD